ncbi:MAG: anthranilate phosphoribosyltransferase [Actinobacteria bacterium]|nr:anthranilate phosphoribosyltransferase [Actinomycetota bacterium]
MSTWAIVLNEIIVDKNLTSENARWAMNEILSGNADPAHISAFLVAMRNKGETPNDIKTFIEVMLEFANPANVAGISVDTCGTGGDGLHTVNISTMASVVVAASGTTVVKHGNRAASSKCGSADVLEMLGVKLNPEIARVSEIANEVGITFFFAPEFHPALRFAGPVRKQLGIRTFFNIIGPLANPAKPQAQIVGVPNPEIGDLISQVLAERGTSAIVILGDDGLDEFSIHAPNQLWLVSQGKVNKKTVTPSEVGIGIHEVDVLAGGDASFNADVVHSVFANDESAKIAGIVDAVAINAACAMAAVEGIDREVDVVESLSRNFVRAKEIIASGLASKKLAQWIAASQK